MAKEKSAPAAAAQDSKKQAINTAMQQIERMYGKGSIMRFGDGAELNVECIPTGSLGLDLAADAPAEQGDKGDKGKAENGKPAAKPQRSAKQKR